MSKRYWVCSARGCNFQRLRDRGFLTLYPAVDDYLFLEVKPENEKFLKKQIELGIHFVTVRKQLITVDQKEVDRMFTQAKDELGKNAQVLVVQGPGSHLEGKVLERDGEKLKVKLQSFTRTYELWVDRLDVVPTELAEIPYEEA